MQDNYRDKVEIQSYTIKEQVVEIHLNELDIERDVSRVRLVLFTGGRRPKTVTLQPEDFHIL